MFPHRVIKWRPWNTVRMWWSQKHNCYFSVYVHDFDNHIRPKVEGELYYG